MAGMSGCPRCGGKSIRATVTAARKCRCNPAYTGTIKSYNAIREEVKAEQRDAIRQANPNKEL